MENKLWWQSKTIQGLVVNLVGSVLIIMGLTSEGDTELLAQTETVVGGLFNLAGLVYSAYGRSQATQPLSVVRSNERSNESPK